MAMHQTQMHKGSLRVFYCPEAAERFEASKGMGFDVALSREESRHAAKVLRLGVGDAARLFDGKGFLYDGEISSIVRNEVRVRVVSRAASNADPRVRLVLLVALLKGKKADFLIQKAVELGVGEIAFFEARRSVSRARAVGAEEDDEEERSGREERWEKIVVSACKQCGRAWLMPVRVLPDLNAALSMLPDTSHRYVFWEALSEGAVPAGDGVAERVAQAFQPARSRENARSHENGPETQAGKLAPLVLASKTTSSRQALVGSSPTTQGSEIVAMVGPEGGFAEEEIARVLRAGFRACSLGPRILRAETAALAAATILLRQAGELGEGI
jgi:16S rRNA (uracil1498-N3)-methyltransferase